MRDFYVWSDRDDRYTGTRIIFLDSEPSNWTWDPVAGQYYWHRFYHHQPDLNFDNPRVLEAITNVLHFWMRAGVDGMRLDAVPYLIEREGTINENLPETHAILKRIRAEMDAHYPDRMLLGEANQWPEDTAEYFGAGDECHMAFHFPLMPRMYMALAMEDRHPITDILRQTPDVPDGCQWAIFLRNHDELTLEMVTDRERDYLWDVYAGDRRMRINLGIRRRLAPLMDRDRRKVELMNGLLLSMPGTPILYYGDEIGMGDNIYLGDRDGVRTPMQWTPDRNGGFSRVAPQRLYLPALQDPLYGYEAVNVESQEADASSLLNWTKRMLQVRGDFKAFGRGTLKFLYPGNRKVFAYLREYDGETILCVVNLARTAQAVELALSEYNGRVPIELTGRTAFPPIGELPYLLTLPAYGFFWFALVEQAAAPAWHIEAPEPMPAFLTLVLRKALAEIVEGRNRQILEGEILPDYLPKQRWFGGKDRPVERIGIRAALPLAGDDGHVALLLDVGQGGESNAYQLPVSVTWSDDALRTTSPLSRYVLAQVRRFRTIGALYDAGMDDAYARHVLSLMRGEPAADPRIVVEAHGALLDMPLDDRVEVRRFNVEQSNTSAVVGDRAVLKIYRRVEAGPHPEVEISRYLTLEAGYANTPALLGSLEIANADGTRSALAVAQMLMFNQGDGWRYMLNGLDRRLEERYFHREHRQVGEEIEPIEQDPDLALVELLGQRTAELHRAFARPTENPAFRPEPVTPADVARWTGRALEQATRSFASLERVQSGGDEAAAQRAGALLARRAEIEARLRDAVSGSLTALKTRLHGDFHLGQVLVVERDFYLIDFEGEPARPLAERRAKSTALRDVAGMARSFDYVAWSAALELAERRTDAADQMLADAMAWRSAALARFLQSYRQHLGDCRVWPEEPGQGERLLELFTLEKALYEVEYEAANRPKWLGIPVAGALALLDTALPKGGA